MINLCVLSIGGELPHSSSEVLADNAEGKEGTQCDGLSQYS